MSAVHDEWKALKAAGGGAGAAGFVHVARPAVVAEKRPDQRRFGADSSAAYDGVQDRLPLYVSPFDDWSWSSRSEPAARLANQGVAVALVYRNGGDNHAELSLHVGRGLRSRCETSIELTAAGLRELARCLIDAAADIDANPAPQGGAL